MNRPCCPRRAARTVAGLCLMAAAAAALAEGPPPGTLFLLHCAGCHGMDGAGHPEAGVPDMRHTLGRFLQQPAGRAFLVQVPGVNNAGLSDAQIAAVTNWQIQRFAAGSAPVGWAPYTAAEVAAARRQRPADIAAARRALVASWPADGADHRR